MCGCTGSLLQLRTPSTATAALTATPPVLGLPTATLLATTASVPADILGQ
eukprot:COSAG06_NODE_24247_length_668_cov_1.112478_1_plen_49_part_01